MAEIMYVDWDGLVYYDTRSKQYIKDIVDQTIKFGGQYTFEDVPAPGFETLHVAYKITDKFVVSPETAYFLETCAGKTFEAGTVILVVEDGESDTYKFDVLFEAYSGAPLTPGGEIDLSNYYTKAQVNDLLSGKVEVNELSNYYLKTETDNKLADKANKSDLDGLATEEFVATALQAIEIPEAPTKVSELENDLGYITEHQDISGKADKTELENLVTKSDFDVVQQQSARNEVKLMMLDEEIIDINQRIDAIPEVDLTGYATEEYVDNKVAEVKVPTAVSELTNDVGYITSADVPETDLSNYYDRSETETLVNEAVNGIEIPDITGYATEEFVNKKIAEAELADKEADLEAYYTKSEVDALIPDVSKFITDVPSEYITESELDAKGYITEHIDISGKADIGHTHNIIEITDYTAPDLELYALKTDIPSIEGLATETFVTNAISNIPEADLSNYYNKLETENLIDSAVGNIDISNKADKDHTHNIKDIIDYVDPDLSEYAKVTDLDNKADLEHTHTLSDISDYVEPDLSSFATKDDVETSIDQAIEELNLPNTLSEYATDAELKDAIDAVEHKIVTKTSELENDAGFVTAGSLPAFVTPDDIADHVTLTEVEEAGFIKSIPDEYITESKLNERQYVTEDALAERGFITDVSDKADKDHSHSYNELTDTPAIPSIEGLATEKYVDDAIANINIPTVDISNLLTKDEANTLIATKANDVPFLDDYRVGTTLGGFSADESLQGMTVVQILTKLLNLTLYVPPTTDFPEGTPEQAAVVISNEHPVYILGESGEQVKLEYDYTTMSPSEAKRDNQTDTYFYQIIDPETGAAIESGYQIATIYQENDYLTVYLPEAVTNFHVEEYSALAGDWSQPTWKLVENTAYVLDGYKAYTVNAEILSGIAIRVIIEN